MIKNVNLFAVDTAVSKKCLPAFMINWMISYKCNLDCSYCYTHDNSMSPVPFEQCKKSADFILKYVDLILSVKPKHEKRAAINLIGGEPFVHPDVVGILEYLHTQYNAHYKDNWKLSVTVTTNGLIGKNILEKCLDKIDQWTVSYHTQTLKKQKDLTLQTIRTLHQKNKKVEVRVLAPSDGPSFFEAKQVHTTLLNEGIDALMKPLFKVQYNQEQSNYFKIFWITNNKEQIDNYNTSKGITCCSERPLILNRNKSQATNFIPSNNFKDWYCAVNWSFLHVDYDLKVYHNISCGISNITGRLESIGHIDNYEKILLTLKNQIETGNVPVIKCLKDLCVACGMCAPKALDKNDLQVIMKTKLNNVDILNFDRE